MYVLTAAGVKTPANGDGQSCELVLSLQGRVAESLYSVEVACVPAGGPELNAAESRHYGLWAQYRRSVSGLSLTSVQSAPGRTADPVRTVV